LGRCRNICGACARLLGGMRARGAGRGGGFVKKVVNFAPARADRESMMRLIQQIACAGLASLVLSLTAARLPAQEAEAVSASLQAPAGGENAPEAEGVDLLEEIRKAGASFLWDPLSGSGIIERDGHSLAFREGASAAVLDNTRVLFTDAPAKREGSLIVTHNFLARADVIFSAPAVPESPRAEAESFYRIGAILIDPGHGGKDPGTNREFTQNGVTTTMREKDINLRVSKLLYDKLKKAYPDKQILLTRDDDRYLSLEDRVEIAHSVPLASREAVLYISIHVNASLDKRASGFEVWYLNPDFRRTVLDQTSAPDENKELFTIFNDIMEEEYTKESVLIARSVEEGLKAAVGGQSKSRGIKADEWFVVRKANMPSVLVELGFITNDEEARLLSSPAYLNKAAEGIYSGLATFVAHFERSAGFTGAL